MKSQKPVVYALKLELHEECFFFGNDDYNFLQVLKKKCWNAQATLILFKILMDGLESMGVIGRITVQWIPRMEE